MQWIIKMRGLSDHLTNATVLLAYNTTGDVGGLKPKQRWAVGETAASQLLGMTIPNSVFHKIKSINTVKVVWDKLKELFEGKLRVWLIDVGRKFQNMCCGEDDDVHVHFENISKISLDLHMPCQELMLLADSCKSSASKISARQISYVVSLQMPYKCLTSAL